MAYKQFNPGDVLTAADVNTYLMKQAVIGCTSGTRPSSPSAGMTDFETDVNMHRTYDGAGWKLSSGLKPHVLLSRTTVSIPNNAVTAINWTTELKDQGGFWTNTSASLITVPFTGIYRVELVVRWATQATAAGLRACMIYVGGTEQMTFYLPTTSALNSFNIITPLTHVMQLSAGEQIECRCYQTSGGALDVIANTRVLVEMVSEV